MTSLPIDRRNGAMGKARLSLARRIAVYPARSLLIALCSLSALFLVFPSLDLSVSGLFHAPGNGFTLEHDEPLRWVREIGKIALLATIVGCLAGLIAALSGRAWRLLPKAHEALYVISVVAIGPGLVVNGIFKEFFGRARPREIIEFGGSLPFSSVWAVSGGCVGNCSFVSGEAGVAAALMSLIFLIPRQDRLPAFFALGLVAALISMNRIAFGGHFVSDVLLSWCIVGFVLVALRPLFFDNGERIDAFVGRAGARLSGRSMVGTPTTNAQAAMLPPVTEPVAFEKVSVVIPARNEAPNLPFLIAEIDRALAGRAYEAIVVDDGSMDETSETLASLRAAGLPVRHIRHETSCGQSRAVRSGVLAARGDVVATIDADGQNDPAFIPVLVAALEAAGKGAGLAAGQRLKRTDTRLKQLSSRAANSLRTTILKDSTRDTGCGLKVMPTALFRRLPFFDGWHRYLPALVLREGLAVVHRDVVDRQRRFGQSNYGIFDRAARGALDLFGVWWLLRRGRKVPAVSEKTIDTTA